MHPSHDFSLPKTLQYPASATNQQEVDQLLQSLKNLVVSARQGAQNVCWLPGCLPACVACCC